jgi:hypothetical protein
MIGGEEAERVRNGRRPERTILIDREIIHEAVCARNQPDQPPKHPPSRVTDWALRTQRDNISQDEGMIALLLEYADLAKFAIGNVNGAVLGPRNAVVPMQAVDGNLAAVIDMAVPY